MGGRFHWAGGIRQLRLRYSVPEPDPRKSWRGGGAKASLPSSTPSRQAPRHHSSLIAPLASDERAEPTTTARQAALALEQIFSIVRGRRTVTPLCLLARTRPLPYVHRRGTIVPYVLRAGCNSPPAVKAATPSPRAPLGFRPRGQQIRCNSGADGIVRMKENGTNAGLPASAPISGRARHRRDFP